MTMGINVNSARFLDATTLTIATGVVVATNGYHIIASEAGTADDLATITLGYTDLIIATNTYRPMLVIKADAGDTITVKDGTGNISLSGGADYDLSGDAVLALFWTGTDWVNLDGSGGGGGGGDLDQLAGVYVSKAGNDANSGLNGNEPKLTIGSAITTASGLITGGVNGVLISVMDGEDYTENLTIPDSVHIVADGATLIGTIELGSNSSISLNRQFSNGNNQNLVNKSGGVGHGFYKANRQDMRGTAGANTGGTALRNVSTNSILFAQVGVLFVNQDGKGVADATGGFGHIHFWTPDLYLAGNNAIGVSAESGSSNFIGYIDHLLEIGTPTNTTGILVDNAGAIVKMTVTELIADTAYNVVSGALHIVTARIVGTRTGTPASEISNVALLGGWGTFISTGSTLLSSLSMNTVNKITSMADPTDPQDGATKAYIDALFPVPATNGGTGQTTYTTGDIIYSSASNTLAKLGVGTNNQVLTVVAGAPAWAAGGGGAISVAVIADVKSSGTDGGTFTAGAWRTRDLNTEISDADGIVSIATNEFTLGAGTYLIEASAPAYAVVYHQVRVYDVTNTAVMQTGTSEYSANNANNRSFVSCVVSPAGSTVYRIEHRSSGTFATTGFGFASSFGDELYTLVKIVKLA